MPFLAICQAPMMEAVPVANVEINKTITAGDYLQKAALNQAASVYVPLIFVAVGGVVASTYASNLKDPSPLFIGGAIVGAGAVSGIVFQVISINHIYNAGRKLNEKPIE